MRGRQSRKTGKFVLEIHGIIAEMDTSRAAFPDGGGAEHGFADRFDKPHWPIFAQ